MFNKYTKRSKGFLFFQPIWYPDMNKSLQRGTLEAKSMSVASIKDEKGNTVITGHLTHRRGTTRGIPTRVTLFIPRTKEFEEIIVEERELSPNAG